MNDELTKCHDCNDGQVEYDTGGQTPWGEFITGSMPCENCNGTGKVRVAQPTALTPLEAMAAKVVVPGTVLRWGFTARVTNDGVLELSGSNLVHAEAAALVRWLTSPMQAKEQSNG